MQACDLQQGLREKQAWSFGAADRAVAVMTPGNAGRAKGPEFKDDVESKEGRGDWR